MNSAALCGKDLPGITARATAAARSCRRRAHRAAALAADYNGASKASHVKDKLIEMIHLNETLYSCGIACSAQGHKTASGNYLIDLLLANVCKQNVTRFSLMKLPGWRKEYCRWVNGDKGSEKDLRPPGNRQIN